MENIYLILNYIQYKKEFTKIEDPLRRYRAPPVEHEEKNVEDSIDPTSIKGGIEKLLDLYNINIDRLNPDNDKIISIIFSSLFYPFDGSKMEKLDPILIDLSTNLPDYHKYWNLIVIKNNARIRISQRMNISYFLLEYLNKYSNKP